MNYFDLREDAIDLQGILEDDRVLVTFNLDNIVAVIEFDRVPGGETLDMALWAFSKYK